MCFYTPSRRYNRSTSVTEPNETIFDFNTRYLKLYDQLETQDKVSFSVIDYENSLRPRFQIYEQVVIAETSTIEEACNLAEKYEIYYRNLTGEIKEIYINIIIIHLLSTIDTFINNSNNSLDRNGMNFRNLRRTSINMPSNTIHKVNYNVPNN